MLKPQPVPQKRKVIDRVVYVMPKDRELQFPAMAIVQTYVNTYDQKIQSNDLSRGSAVYELMYDLVMPEEDWKFFLDAGTTLAKPRTRGLRADLYADMSDEKLLQFLHTGRHAAQACRIISGVEALPYPHVRQVQFRYTDKKWALLGDLRNSLLNVDYPLVPIAPQDLLQVQSDEFTGVVGFAGWGTYLAVSMGLPVVEIVADDRPRNWLSKWANKGYRVVDSKNPDHWPLMVVRAMASAERELDVLWRNFQMELRQRQMEGQA